jgi:hypothetical protein
VEAIVCAVALIRPVGYLLQDTSLSPTDGMTTSNGKDPAFHEKMPEHEQQIRSMVGSLPHEEEPDIELSGQMSTNSWICYQ